MANISAKESRETSKNKRINKDEKVVVKEKNAFQQNRKSGEQKLASEKKEKDADAAAKVPEQHAKEQRLEGYSGSKALPMVKTKEKSNPKNMSLQCLISKTKQTNSKAKLYDSSDDNFNEEQERGHKELAKELSISSDDDNQSAGNTEFDANNKKDVDRVVESQTS